MTIKQIIADIFAQKGGYANQPADKGGPTNYGITTMIYAEYFNRTSDSITKAEIRAITPALAEKIYYTLYHVRPNINLLPGLIQPIMLDMAVNHSRRESVKILQTSLSTLSYPVTDIDGIIDRKTIDATEKAIKDLGSFFLRYLVDTRIAHYKDIIEADPSQAVFENGWIARAESFRPEAVA